MSDRWKLGSYTFEINPSDYSENITIVGDNAVTLGGFIVSQPTLVKEEYSFSSTFWQGNPRILNTVSMPNGSGIKMLSGNYYVLNNSTKKIDVYNTGYSSLKHISVSGNNLTSFDVAPVETCYVVENLSSSQILHTVTSSTQSTKTISGLSGNVTGIKFYNNNLWMVTDKDILYNTDMNFKILNSVNLPSISPNYLGYRGLGIGGSYLLVTMNTSDMSGVYHIDMSTGSIVNAFSIPTMMNLLDVVYDGTNFIFINDQNQLVFTNGNTVLADIYTIDNQIKTSGTLTMVDDMGVNRTITVSQFNPQRVDGYMQMYKVDITGTKVDRGVW